MPYQPPQLDSQPVAQAATFCLLGPLLVRRAGAAVSIAPGKQRALLAALLLNAGHVVPVDELAEMLWGAWPPPSARASLQNYVMRLRKSLTDTSHSRISTEPGGYLISVTAGELDVDCFESLLAAARENGRVGSWDSAAAQLRTALALWRGQPLSDVNCDALVLREMPRLMELRLQALEARIDADLHLGRHRDVIIELGRLAADHPLRERLHGQLMLALHRDGQQASALAAYQSVRRTLVDELGTEPGLPLRQLHQQVLIDDPAPAAGSVAGSSGGSEARAASEPTRPSWAVTPRQLPAAVGHFTGRAAELRALTMLLDSEPETAPTVVISAIGGAAGVGKTALAVHWAHQVAERFPDGQLFVSLRGFDPSGAPVTAAEAVRGLLEALGMPPARIPPNPDARAALYRSLLAGRRMLVLLDNARDAEQVRPLLPGSPGHLVVVTSRSQLTGLVTTGGASPLHLDVLTEEDAVQLLAARIGAERVAAEAAAAKELTGLCARLPLALSIVTARALAAPWCTIAALTDEMRHARSRLDELDAGDASASVRAVLSWSYQTLSGPAARMFRLLGDCPGPDFSIPAAGALAGIPAERADVLLGELTETQLVTRQPGRRFAFHDLLRAYAMERSAAQETLAGRRAATRRLLHWYLHSATAAARIINPRRRHVTLDPAEPGAEPLQFTGYHDGLAWLDAEHANLVAAISLAATTGEHEVAWKLPLTLWDLFTLRGLFDDWVRTHQAGLASAAALGEQFGQAWLLNNLGAAYMMHDHHQQARACYEQLLPLCRDLDNKPAEASILHNLGLMQMKLSQPATALDTLGSALAAYRNLADRDGEGMTFNTIGDTLRQLGRLSEALDCYQQAVAAFSQTGNRFGESIATTDQAHAYLELGEHQQSVTYSRRAVALSREVGHLPGEAHALHILGHALTRTGRTGEARQNWLLTAQIYDDLGDPRATEIRALL